MRFLRFVVWEEKKIAGIKFQQKEEKEEHPTKKNIKTCWFLLKIVRRV